MMFILTNGIDAAVSIIGSTGGLASSRMYQKGWISETRRKKTYTSTILSDFIRYRQYYFFLFILLHDVPTYIRS